MKSNKVIETHDYSRTEHIGRKWGQWYPDPSGLMKQLEGRGFHIAKKRR